MKNSPKPATREAATRIIRLFQSFSENYRMASKSFECFGLTPEDIKNRRETRYVEDLFDDFVKAAKTHFTISRLKLFGGELSLILRTAYAGLPMGEAVSADQAPVVDEVRSEA